MKIKQLLLLLIIQVLVIILGINYGMKLFKKENYEYTILSIYSDNTYKTYLKFQKRAFIENKKFLDEHFVLKEINCDKDKKILKKYKLTGAPAIVILSNNGKVVDNGVGFYTVEELRQELNFVLNGKSPKLFLLDGKSELSKDWKKLMKLKGKMVMSKINSKKNVKITKKELQNVVKLSEKILSSDDINNILPVDRDDVILADIEATYKMGEDAKVCEKIDDILKEYKDMCFSTPIALYYCHGKAFERLGLSARNSFMKVIEYAEKNGYHGRWYKLAMKEIKSKDRSKIKHLHFSEINEIH